MAYGKEKTLESEMAVKVLRVIEGNEDGSYTREIANRLDSSPSSVSNLLKTLRDYKIIERGKRTKAQYYVLDFEGLVGFWYDETLEALEESNKSFISGIEKDFREDEEEIKTFAENYFRFVLSESNEDITLKEFLFDSFAFALSRARGRDYYESSKFQEEDKFPGYLVSTLMGLIEYMDTPDYSSVVSALLRMKDDEQFSELLDESNDI